MEFDTYRSLCRVWWVKFGNDNIRKHTTYERKETVPSLAKRRSKDNEPLNSPDVRKIKVHLYIVMAKNITFQM